MGISSTESALKSSTPEFSVASSIFIGMPADDSVSPGMPDEIVIEWVSKFWSEGMICLPIDSTIRDLVLAIGRSLDRCVAGLSIEYNGIVLSAEEMLDSPILSLNYQRDGKSKIVIRDMGLPRGGFEEADS